MTYVLVRYPNLAAAAAPRAEFTYWDTRAQAQQVLDELTPCGPRCIGVHAIVAVGPTHPRIRGPGSLSAVNQPRGDTA